MGTVHRLASHTKHQPTLNMKAFVAVIAALCSTTKAQILVSPYAGLTGLPIAGAPLALSAQAAPIIPAAPVTYAATAPIIPAPTPSQQFHAQDEFGNVAHGYANINSAKHEVGNTYAGVTGSWSYVDPNGELQTTSYIADGLGFRVQATNLPVAPVADLKQPVAPVVELAQPVFDLVGPVPVEDTPEVKAAKAEFAAAYELAASREKRSTPAATAVLAKAPTPLVTYASAPVAPVQYSGLPLGYGHPLGYGLPLGLHGAYNLPAAVVPSAAATREAVLTKIKLNPGHAIAYKVE